MDAINEENPQLEEANLANVSDIAGHNDAMNSHPIDVVSEDLDVCTGPNPGDRITFIIGYKRFVIEKRLLTAHPNTTLGRMFCSSNRCTHYNQRGEYVVPEGVSHVAFGAILDYYKHGNINCPPNITLHELKNVCDFFLIPFNINTVKCQNLENLLHELSNDGAHQAFKRFFNALMIPVMASCAQRGHRKSHIVVLLDDDVVNWSNDTPLEMGDKYYQPIRSTAMHRLLKYIENHDVVKHIMSSHQLKGVCCGLQSFPKDMKKFQEPHVHDKLTYIRRYFICISWEKPDARSRYFAILAAIRGMLDTLPRDPNHLFFDDDGGEMI